MNPRDTREPAVYALRAGGRFFYVGHTTQSVKARLWEHRSRARRGHPQPVWEYMREVGIENVEIVMLQRLLPEDDAELVEMQHIRRLLLAGEPLTNDMSIDGIVHSNGPSMRARISATKRGRSTWIKGKSGEAAGWTPERRARAAARITEYNNRRRAQ